MEELKLPLSVEEFAAEIANRLVKSFKEDHEQEIQELMNRHELELENSYRSGYDSGYDIGYDEGYDVGHDAGTYEE